MKKVEVRCWKMVQYRPDTGESHELFITYPESTLGHSLITCLSCGALFAGTVDLDVYVGPPLESKLTNTFCPKCSKCLRDNWAYYPETYVIDRRKYSFERPSRIPPDDESLLVEFDGIYES